MKRFLRILACLLAGVMLLVAGCNKTITSVPGPVSIVTSVPVGYEAPLESPAPSAPAPTQTVPSSAADAFRALDREVFIRYITQDGFTFHQMLTNPASYGLSSDSVDMTWGEFTAEYIEAYGRACADDLERLLLIPRSELNARDQLSYDILQQYLEDASAENTYAYYLEPLTEHGGQHTILPLALGLFKIEDEQDAKDYLQLLEDASRYLGQILSYEKKRAEHGLFMTEQALDEILADCKDIVNARDSFYLIGTFNAAIDELDGVSAETAAAYKARSEAAVKGAFADAYQSLYNGLEALRGSCRERKGLCAVSDIGASYFEYGMQREGDNRLSAEETLELLEKELAYEFAVYQECYREHPDAYRDPTLTSGNVQTDLETLESLSERLLFKLPEHTLQVSAVPEELENQMSGASYVIPPIDSWTDNEILINPAYTDASQLMTLAHECYPGHMFQFVYQRALTDTGLMQRALHYGGYAEGWAQMGEYLIAVTQQSYNTAYSELRFYDNMILRTLLSGIVSIRVNYYNYNRDSIRSYLASWNITDEGTVNAYYDWAIEEPFYFFNYATGYAQLAALMRDAEENIGESFDRSAFLKAYLDLGPGYFNLIQERMDVWIDENTPE